MTHLRSESEIVTVRKLAQELAAARKERTTSVHLLAAIASREGPAAELLHERRLDDEAILKATRSFDEDVPDVIGSVIAAARDISTRSPAPEPNALHLLLALLADRRCAAHRALIQCGVDLGRLRTAAMQIALGVVAARRPVASLKLARREPPPPAPPPSTARGGAQAGVTVSLFPPSRPAHPAAGSITKPAAGSITKPAAPADRSPSADLRVGRPAPVSEPRPVKAGSTPKPPDAARKAGSRKAARSVAAARFDVDRSRFPTLASLGRNLSLAACEGKLEPIVGREAEIDEVLDVLAKRHANSPCLVGPAGVGKTSIARGIAQRLYEIDAESDSDTHRVIEVSVSELVAGTGARGSLADRVAAIRAEVAEIPGRVTLFVDEIHGLFSGGVADEAMTQIKVALTAGDLSILGATTFEEYKRSIECDSALARRFTVVEIDEPAEDEAFFLLRSVAEGLGRHHGLEYTDEALAASITWSMRYLPGRALPDKAIAILDLAGAKLRRKGRRPGRAAGAAEGLRSGKLAPVASLSVGTTEVAHVVAELADLPVERLLETDRERMLGMEKLLAERVVGHAGPLARIATILRRNAAGLRGQRPIGSFLLLGPTGVGKTETAKAIAEVLFHSPDAMTRLDFSEYAEAHAVARLVGAPPGYVGYEAGGQLTEAVRRRPYQVILLDEIEKAHRDVLEAFLQVFDEGRLTDGRGRRVDFTNTVIVLTSNLGSAEAGAIRTERAVGFSRSASPAQGDRIAGAMIAAARAHLPPELYNRLDEVLCFAALTRADVTEIARRLLEGLENALDRRGIRLQVAPDAIEVLLTAGGFDPDFGARPMKRAIARLIEAPLAEMILRGELDEGAVAMVHADEGEIVVDAVAARAAVG